MNKKSDEKLPVRYNDQKTLKQYRGAGIPDITDWINVSSLTEIQNALNDALEYDWMTLSPVVGINLTGPITLNTALVMKAGTFIVIASTADQPQTIKRTDNSGRFVDTGSSGSGGMLKLENVIIDGGKDAGINGPLFTLSAGTGLYLGEGEITPRKGVKIHNCKVNYDDASLITMEHNTMIEMWSSEYTTASTRQRVRPPVIFSIWMTMLISVQMTDRKYTI